MEKNQKLFEIASIIKDWETETITVNLEPNSYVKDIVMIDFTEFKVFLENNDRLYYETHDCSTGEYISKAYTMTIYEYLDNTDFDYLEEDLYDYVVATCIDWSKALERVMEKVKTTSINHFNTYLS